MFCPSSPQIQSNIIPHAIVVLPKTDGMEMLLCYEDEGVYVNTYGRITKDVVLQWGEMPTSVGRFDDVPSTPFRPCSLFDSSQTSAPPCPPLPTSNTLKSHPHQLSHIPSPSKNLRPSSQSYLNPVQDIILSFIFFISCSYELFFSMSFLVNCSD